MNATPSASPRQIPPTDSRGWPSDQTGQVDATPRMRATGERALVLGGGGSAGNAWLIGVVAGLADAGLDVATADLVIGTSAGSTAAAQVTSAPPAELLAALLAASTPPPTGLVGSVGGRSPRSPAVNHLERTSRIIDESRDIADMRRRLGAAALELDAASDGSWHQRWRTTVAARLPSQDWPRQSVLITAVDAQTGEPVVFDRLSAVDLVDAVAASCSSGLPYRIGDALYLDGGYRSNADNADLAAGYARVLVLSPFGGRSRTPMEWGTHLATQVDALRAAGCLVETVFPDSGSRTAFGDNVMNPATRGPAARAGYDQGRRLAGHLAEFWL